VIVRARSFFWLPTAATAVLGFASVAHASGFATARFGGEHGHPTTDNPTAVYYNPAALTASQGTHLYADGMFVLRRASYTHEPAPTDVPPAAGAERANTGEATLTNVAAVPMFGASTRLGDLALGLGVFVPFGGGETWDTRSEFTDHPSYPGPVDGVQRWYTISGTIQSIYATLAAAYPLGESGLSLGVSGNLIYSLVDTTNARTALGNDDVGIEGRSHLKVSGWQASFGVGVLYEPVKNTLWLGASYQARPNVAGGMVLSGDLEDNFTGSVDVTSVDFHQDLPDVIRLGARYRPEPRLELRLFGDYTRWSSLDDQCVARRGEPCTLNPDGSNAPGSGAIQSVPRHWNDAFGVRAGVSGWLGSRLELMSGLGYDSNAIPDSTLEPSFMDYDDFSAAVGARYEVASGFFLGACYTEFYNLPRDNSGSSVHPHEQAPSNGPDAGGRYTEWVGLLNLDAELVF
jgi:long-chain fatty acid transport protein